MTPTRHSGFEVKQAGQHKQARNKQWGMGLALSGSSASAFAGPADPVEWQLNMGRGVTALSNHAYDAHMMAFWICVGIGLIVFGAMAYAMFAFRKSRGAVAATFSHNTTAEIVWTVIPVVLLIGMAWPATTKLIAMYDTRDSAMTVKVTGYQWMWKYDYLGEGVEFTSRLDRDSDRMRQSHGRPTMESNPHYLLDVDHVLVLPIDTKIRFVITADDVIHSWWVPALGWKQDAIPGIVNEAWADIRTPGTYRGQCAELCGKDHGFMPIVVKAVSKAEFQQWLAAEKAKRVPEPAAAAPANAAPATPADATAAPAPTAQAQPQAAAPVAG
jgi:cytochrome c oxidase subunit II